MTVFDHRIPLMPLRAFLARVLRFGAISAGIIGMSLGIGTAGYHHFGGLSWTDSLLNAAMILTGMGPVDRMETEAAKLFATGYALYSGIAFLSTATLLFGPILSRLIHWLHLEAAEEAKRGGSG